MTDCEHLDHGKNAMITDLEICWHQSRKDANGSAYIPVKDELKGRARDSTMVYSRSERFQHEKFES